jgi:ATP-dependent helicase IRC3
MRKSTLVFCVNLNHVRELTNTFRAFGVDARYVYSGTPANERKALINSFKEGTFPVLVNCGDYYCDTNSFVRSGTSYLP